MVSVGLVSAGEMGSAVGERLRRGGCRVLTTVGGRSARTRDRAERSGLERVETLADLLSEADVVLSIVPPAEALVVALELATAARQVRARPLVADLNAVSPATVGELARALGNIGLVDGSISGPPPGRSGTTRIYLSGPRAGEVAALPFDGVDLRLVGAELGSASAVKMCTASVYKGRVALLAQALRTADAHGVVEHVLDDLAESGLADRDRAGALLARATAKAWRYVAEMEQIATTQSRVGLSPALFTALAAVYRDLAARAAPELAAEDIADDVALEDVLRGLRPSV